VCPLKAKSGRCRLIMQRRNAGSLSHKFRGQCVKLGSDERSNRLLGLGVGESPRRRTPTKSALGHELPRHSLTGVSARGQ
jgi:hypothetical protein